MENVKSERTLLLVIGGGIAVFMLMIFLYSQGGAANSSVAAAGANSYVATQNAGVQDVYIKALNNGSYDKEEVTVKKGIPVRIHFSAESGAGCGKYFMIRKYNVQLLSSNGEEKVAQFTPTETGTVEYSCSMRMFRGTMNVVA